MVRVVQASFSPLPGIGVVIGPVVVGVELYKAVPVKSAGLVPVVDT